MCNRYDAPYNAVKKEHAENIKELTCLWNVGPKNRQIGHENYIYKYSDSRCAGRY